MAQLFYTLNQAQGKEGPYDLLTIMKRIKSGKIDAATPVFLDENETSQPAAQVEELTLFFRQLELAETVVNEIKESEFTILRRWLSSGWRFMVTHQLMAVLAGAMVLVCFLIGLALLEPIGLGPTIVLVLISYWTLQAVIMVCSLRINRGQHINGEFFHEAILLRFIPLLFGASMLAMLMLMGLMLFIIPGIIFLSIYMFTPLFISDRKMSIFAAMGASRRLTGKLGSAGFAAFFALIALYILGTLTVVLIPLIFPVVTGAIAEIYDQYAPQI